MSATQENPAAPQIHIEQEAIDAHESTCTAFLNQVLDVEGALVTDLSQLSDFAFTGNLPAGTLDIKEMSMHEALDAWDAWAIKKVQDVYGITVDSPRVLLLDLCKQIEAKRAPTIH